ncbi:MAG: DUF4288 domain-containing protein [Terriglobales bacterium]
MAKNEKAGWYTVRVLIRCTGEGQPTEVSLYEDRLVLVNAKSHAEAKKKAAQSVRKSGVPYKNPFGNTVRWKLTKIVDSVELFEDEAMDGKQVYWRYIYAKDPIRRLRKERAIMNGIGDLY